MMPLTMASIGEMVTLESIRGGRGLRARLADLGLCPGVTVRVVQTGAGGPVIVAFRDDARLALGRGMAHHIQVVPTTGY